MLISQVLDGYWLDKRTEFSPATIEAYKFHFRYFVEFVGDVEFETITSTHIKRFLDHLIIDRKLSKRTKHDAWVPLSSLWTWAEKELEAKHIIRGKVPMPEMPSRVIEIYTANELSKLLKACEHSKQYTRLGKTLVSKRPTATRDKAIILTLVDSGLRSSELCALLLSDYNENRARLHVAHGKGDKERYVVIGDRTGKAIWRYLATRPKAKKTEPLFLGLYGRPMSRAGLYHLISKLGEKADVDAWVHKFRHTFAVWFLRRGGNLIQLRDLMGHEDIETLQVYVRLAEVDIDEAVKFSPVDGWRL